MNQLVECIPNFSEGQRADVVEGILGTIKSVPGVLLLDCCSNPSHNRSVVTFVGTPEGVAEAAFLSAKQAVKTIDMTKHKGEHPRMGAVDVIPFVPVKDMAMAECVALSKAVAARISGELSVPVYLYEESAVRPERANLASIRKGQFEGMAEKIQSPGWEPDFGPRAVHPTAGAVAVGARAHLVAYNINLNTHDIHIANSIAKTIRESSGGLKYVKAIGVMLEEKSRVQVSINMTNYEKTPLYRVFEMVKAEARRFGVTVESCEIAGLTPMNALIDSAMYYLQLNDFASGKQVLENHLM